VDDVVVVEVVVVDVLVVVVVEVVVGGSVVVVVDVVVLGVLALVVSRYATATITPRVTSTTSAMRIRWRITGEGTKQFVLVNVSRRLVGSSSREQTVR
jgi:hypothetical protein